MFSEKTRNAMAVDIILALEFPLDTDNDVLVVKTARDIFHTEWADDDIQIMCKFIRKNGTSNMYWPNDTEWIFDQIFHLAFDKATDSKIINWYKGIWGDDKTLKYIIECE
jgi:hypothetical protein